MWRAVWYELCSSVSSSTQFPPIPIDNQQREEWWLQRPKRERKWNRTRKHHGRLFRGFGEREDRCMRDRERRRIGTELLPVESSFYVLLVFPGLTCAQSAMSNFFCSSLDCVDNFWEFLMWWNVRMANEAAAIKDVIIMTFINIIMTKSTASKLLSRWKCVIFRSEHTQKRRT